MDEVAKRLRVKAVSYIRVSGRGQADGDGPERQRQTIAKFAVGNGFEVVEEFSDLGISGTTELPDRPGLTSLFERVSSNGVRTVLVERPDRLARDLIVNEMLVQEFKRAGVKVVSADSGTDLTEDDDPSRILIRQVLAAVAQFSKTEIVRKLRSARDRKRARGERVEGAKPFGELPDEADTLQRMRELRNKPRGERLSFAEIASTLNAEGHKNRSGRVWKKSMVHHILSTR